MAKKSTTTSNFAEIGSTGLASFGGSIRDDFLAELRGKDGYRKYNEMRLNSPIIAGLLFAIENPLRQLSWTFESGEEEDERIEFLTEAKEQMSLSWNDHIIEALTMLPFGFSCFEIVYKRNSDGRIGWRKFAPRGQDTVQEWMYDEEGGLAGIKQVAAPVYHAVEIPVEKLLVYRTRVERGNPEGRSILRSAWIPYYYTKHIQQIEAIGVERDLAGMPVITLPQGADTSDTDSSDFGVARKLVRNIRNDEQAGVVLPGPDWKLELLSTGGSRQFNTDAIIRRYESRMLMAALAQFLILGQDGVGSFALSADQTDFFNLALTSVADNIADTFTKYAIPRLLELNGMDPEGVELTHGSVAKEDLGSLGTFLSQAAPLLNWSPEDEVWLRNVGGLPEKDLEELEQQQLEKEEQKAAAAAALQENLKKAKQQKSGEEDESAEGAVDEMAADPQDVWKRRRAELKMQRIMKSYLEAQRKRVLKSAKSMRG